MLLLEQRTFLLDNRAKFVFLEQVSDCLRTNRVGEGAIDEFGGLNCIVKPSSDDLAQIGRAHV